MFPNWCPSLGVRLRGLRKGREPRGDPDQELRQLPGERGGVRGQDQ